MNIIILAAGMGTRLKEMTKKMPKCLVKVNGTKIIDRFLYNIKVLSPKNVVVVTGHLSDILENAILEKWNNVFDIKFIKNEIYNSTNNIYSLWLAKEYMQNDYMIVEADVFTEKGFFDNVVFDKNYWFVDKFTEKNDGCMLSTNNDSKIKKIEIIRTKLDNYSENFYKSTGIVYVKSQQDLILSYLENEIKEGNTNIYYDLLFSKYIDEITLNTQYVNGKKWFEIDNQEDLNEAEILFKE